MTLNILMLILYIIIVLAFGLIGKRKDGGGLDGFVVAKRNIGVRVGLLSMGATILGGSSTLGIAGLGFEMGLVGAWWLLVGSIGLIILGWVFAKKIREKGPYTLPEILGRIYGDNMRIATSILVVVSWVGVIGAQIVASGRLLKTISLLPIEIIMFGCTFVFMLYTLLGGQRSVMRTDCIQFIILYAGICFVGLPIILNMVGGISGLKDSINPSLLYFPVNEYFNWGDLIVLFLVVGIVYIIGPDIYSRIFSLKDIKSARRVPVYTGLIIIPFAISIVVLGLSARVLAPHISPEEAIPFLVVHHLPPVISGLLVISFIAAFMSSADTCLLTASTILSMDIYPKLKYRVYKDEEEKLILLRTKLCIVLMAGISLLLAVYFKRVISILLLSYSIFVAGVALPLILGFYKRILRLNGNGALASLIGGGCSAMYLYIAKAKDRLVDVSGLIPFAVSIILLFGVSWVFKIRQQD